MGSDINRAAGQEISGSKVHLVDSGNSGTDLAVKSVQIAPLAGQHVDFLGGGVADHICIKFPGFVVFRKIGIEAQFPMFVQQLRPSRKLTIVAVKICFPPIDKSVGCDNPVFGTMAQA